MILTHPQQPKGKITSDFDQIFLRSRLYNIGHKSHLVLSVTRHLLYPQLPGLFHQKIKISATSQQRRLLQTSCIKTSCGQCIPVVA